MLVYIKEEEQMYRCCNKKCCTCNNEEVSPIDESCMDVQDTNCECNCCCTANNNGGYSCSYNNMTNQSVWIKKEMKSAW